MNRTAALAAPNVETQILVPVTASAQPAKLCSAWQVVGAVARGASHERLGMPCQDAQDYRVLPDGTLLVALADGAGSASYSDQGARCAVNEAIHVLTGLLEQALPGDDDGWQRLLREVFRSAREAVLRLAETNAAEEADLDKPGAPGEPVGSESLPALFEEEPAERSSKELRSEELGSEELYSVESPTGEYRSEEQQRPPERAYATTLTCAIAAPDRLVVGQIGDGLVVAGDGERLFAVTRLQRGEYANETHFLTQPGALDQLIIENIAGPVSTLAVMSDGLIRLALKMPLQEPHAPFFEPLFRVTAAIGQPGGAPDETEAARQLSAFLGSERVNARTDDDKSLVLAVCTESLRKSGARAYAQEGTMEVDVPIGTAGSAARPAKVKGAGRAPAIQDWERE